MEEFGSLTFMWIPFIFLFVLMGAIIIISMSPGILVTISLGLLGVSAALLGISVQKDVEYAFQLRIVSGGLVLAFVYFLIEALRFGHWEIYYSHPSDDTATKPPPKLLIVRIIQWLKDHSQHRC